MIKKILLTFILFLGIINTFGYTNISSCQTINSTFPFDSDREIRLNQSIINIPSNCFTIKDTSNFKLDCQSNSITGNFSGSGIITTNLILATTNITIKNCNIKNFNNGIQITEFIKMENTTFENINISNSSSYSIDIPNGIILAKNVTFNNFIIENNLESIRLRSVTSGSPLGIKLSNFLIKNNTASWSQIYLSGLTNSIFENITIKNSNSGGFYIQQSSNNNIFKNINVQNIPSTNGGFWITFNSDNNTFDNIYIKNTTRGFYIHRDSSENIIKNSQIYNASMSSIYFAYSSTQYPENNIIYNNTLSGNPAITSLDWTKSQNNIFNFSGIGNNYPDINLTSTLCFDNPTNLSCDYIPTFIQQQVPQKASITVTQLPSIKITSLVISTILISLTLLF